MVKAATGQKNTPPPDPHNRFGFVETRKQRGLRLLLAGCLFAGVVWGLWANSDRRQILPGPRDALDATGVLSARQEALTREYLARFFAAYGVSFRICIQNAPLRAAGAEDAGRVFLGLNPRQKQAVFYAPPLVRAALGEETVRALNRSFFAPYFARGDWPEGLADALSLIASRLDEHLRKHEESP